MKKKNFKKPLLVCLSALTLFSATTTSIVSSAIDNQPQVVRAIRKAERSVSGKFSVTTDFMGADELSMGLDIRPLKEDQNPLGGSVNFAVVFANVSVSVKNVLMRQGLSGELFDSGIYDDDRYFIESNGKIAVVFVWKGSQVRNYDSVNFVIDEREGIDCSDIADDLQSNSVIYGGYFGTTATDKITAEHIPGMIAEDNKGPLISGSQTTYTTSVDSPISVETIKSALTAIDETDGNVTSSIVIKSDNYTANNKKLGSYDIVFEASDKKGNKSTLTVTVVVQDLVYPTINGAETQTFSYTAAKTLDDVKALYTVSDNYDTSLSISVDSQSPNFDGTKVGTYSLVLSATDSSSHKTTKSITVNIIDDVAPVISGSTSFVTSNVTATTLDDIKSRCGITSTDAIDGACSVNVKADTLTGNSNKVGNYYVIFESVDTKGNKSELRVDVSITDGIPPVFYIDETIIYAANNIAMTNVDLCNLMIATCEIDSSKPYSLAITDTNGYLTVAANGDEVPLGNYEVVATVTYKDGNKDVYTKTISVYDPDAVDLETEEVNKNIFECIVQFFKNCVDAIKEKRFWKSLFDGRIFKDNMTKIVEVELETTSPEQE